MYSENGVLIDFDEIAKLVNSADVFVVAFSNFPERLIVDTRVNENELPLVQVVEPARSARDRVAWLHRRRPSLGVPQQFSFFAWPHSPGFLASSGTWDRIRRSVNADAEPAIAAQCDAAMRQLENLDAAAMLAVLKGEGCLTLWPRQEDSEDEEPT
jgi:hypothetical protein